MSLTAAISLTIVCLLAPFLVLFTIPGLWVMVGCGWVVYLIAPERFSIWTLIAVTVLSLGSDLADLGLSAAFAGRAGGGKRAALGAVLGAIVGAIVGTGVMPIVGTLLGGCLGAGLGASIAASTRQEATWRDSARVGRSASLGWLTAIGMKLTLGAMIAATLISAVWIP